MDISEHLSRSLKLRFTEYIDAENAGDVTALYEFIDPEIRTEREAQYANEPHESISSIQSFVDQIRSAKIESFAIAAFVQDGGASRNHRPTAMVLSQILYNEARSAEFRTPWVLREEVWYTRGTGKHPAFGD